MTTENYPLELKFHISTLSNDFSITDSQGNYLCYIRQKLLKLIDEIDVYSDQSKSEILYTIKADRWLDFNASYSFNDDNGYIGRVGRKGWASFWRAHFQIFDINNVHDYTITEENPWSKVLDSMFGQIPILGFFTGLVFNAKYIVKDANNELYMRLTKRPSLFGRKFTVDKLTTISKEAEKRMLLSLTMMILLERRRS